MTTLTKFLVGNVFRSIMCNMVLSYTLGSFCFTSIKAGEREPVLGQN